jgi:hypothetical protein
MWHVYEAELAVGQRQTEHRRWAAQQRLARQARTAAPGRGPGAPGRLARLARLARLLHRLGGLLVAWGSRLQGLQVSSVPEAAPRSRPQAPAVSAGWR